jgi:UDP-N-acetylglucosamine transferase subunit ALG13
MFVFATVGTDHHPFDRFISWIDTWHGQTSASTCEVFVQRGTCSQTPNVPSAQWLDPQDLATRMQRADAIVCHGGPSTIMEARHAGIVPIVIPRDPALGEHVDEHQLRFAKFMESKGAIVCARTPAELATHLDRIAGGHADRVTAGTTEETLSRISEVIDDVMSRPCRPLVGARSVRS